MLDGRVEYHVSDGGVLATIAIGDGIRMFQAFDDVEGMLDNLEEVQRQLESAGSGLRVSFNEIMDEGELL